MSSGKLDMSLDDLLTTRRQSGQQKRGGNRRARGGRSAAAAPVGGVQKNAKQNKQAKAAPVIPVSTGGESKIMISNLPRDVDENQLKDYFAQATTIGRTKKITLQYGPNGQSLGSATVSFHKADQAAKAVQALDKIRIDNRLLKVDVLVSARDAPAPASLADRITGPKKDKPKPATATKATGAGSDARGRGGRRGRGRGGRNPRDKKKSVEEMDAEMEDYFPAGEGGNDAMIANGGAVQAAGGDTAMDDEML